MKILHTYRGLLRSVRRLPLDVITLERAKSELKNRFKDSHGPQSSLVTKWQATFDAILLRHDYSRINDVFDDLFKKRTRNSMSKWLYQLRETDYLKLKPYWPQVELIQEIIDNESNVVTKYDQKLARQRTNDICVYDFLKLDKQRNNSVEMYDLSPIKRQLEVPTDSYKCIVERAKELFDFLMKNHSRLDISNKVANFEMIYEPTTTGLPWSADYRDLRLRKHISNIKLLFESNLPMKQDDLAQLSSIMLDPNFTINPIFYKVMIREREKALETPPNPLVSKHLQLKQLLVQ
ncbi:uncharacterized protein KQ657_002367 [Scheffersomyces spartinae]|uniref:Genetic interactor of prohibitin 5, mitochondrial n=1 Tax=Scheffersomyces spartinae TaxID=45513 RepID=A0A9P7VDT5_9ASCO|nr:uncharacterized protein KQ657_002367 [Scheffersomyces spartinae]KAG7195980.1 hypothetical protein KQ657_002367 [Scheffersomyces spartinae]